MSEPITLDIGCGKVKRPGCIGVDMFPGSADVLTDLEHGLPFADNTFDKVVSFQVLEHLDNVVGMMEEIHRVLKPGGKAWIEVPHFSCIGGFTDPTHKRHFGMNSMAYFAVDNPHKDDFTYTDRKFKVLRNTITFNRALICLIPKLIYAISPKYYEKYFPFIFPARFIEFELEAVK